MIKKVLVLHGPNIRLRTEPTLKEIEGALETRSKELGIALVQVASNSEAALCDAVEHHRDADAVIVNAGAIAPIAYALAEALSLISKPAAEVVLDRAANRPPSALAAVISGTYRGADAYVEALSSLADGRAADDQPQTTPTRAGSSRIEKTLGKRRSDAVDGEIAKKTLGRQPAPPSSQPTAPKDITRASLRAMLADRLAGKITPDALTMWAREKWQSLQWGGAAEPGHRELLEETLMLLSASQKHTDAALITFMAKLEA